MKSLLALIDLLISPAIMVSATGLLLLSVNHRTGRITDRLRGILDEMRSLERGESSRRHSLLQQLQSLRTRGRQTQRSIIFFLIAVCFYVLTAGSMIVELYGGWYRYLPLLFFYGGLISLLVGLVYYFLEIRESFRISTLELDYWLEGEERE